MLLRVLLVGSDSDLVDAVAASLRRSADIELVCAADGDRLAAAVTAAVPDVIVVCFSQPGQGGLDPIRRVAAEQPRPIVMFVEVDDPGLMEAAIAAGVTSYNAVGGALPDVEPIVRTAVALFRRSRRIEEELAAARSTLADSAVIDRAKAWLIRHRGQSEPEAYRLLRRRAMDQGRRIADVAREILQTGE